MYNIKDDFNETVTLEKFIYVAANIKAEAIVDSDDEEIWEEENYLEQSMESIIAYLFNLECVRDELSWEIEDEADKILETKYR